MTQPPEFDRRRTFAIISHPDAGKTTLTEKLLLFGGAIQLAGQVKAKASRRNTRSDWMEMERERGISVVTSVMTFDYAGLVFNLLDTPGHEDFSEDTYRTLSAVDSAVMVIDAAKGIEARTRKLFEVCRLRDIPIITFINKMDREARDPFELLEEIEKTLALDTAPLSWPLGPGRTFAGVYDLERDAIRRMDADDEAPRPVAVLEPAAFDDLPAGKRPGSGRRGDRARQGGVPAVRPGLLPRGAPDPGPLRQRAPQFRRARPDRPARGDRAAAGAAQGGAAAGGARRAGDDRLRLQDPGEHGPQPSRPHRLRARLLGHAQARHEGDAGAHRQADQPARAAILLRAGPRARRRGLRRRHRRHPQSRHLADRRYADRGRDALVPRRAELRPGNSPARPRRGRHARQESPRGVEADGRGGRRPGAPAARRGAADRRRRRRAPARRAQGAARLRIQSRRSISRRRASRSAAG